MSLGEPNLACVAEATPANTVRVGARDTCPWGIRAMPCFGCLSWPRSLPRLIRLALLASSEAWLLLSPGTLCAVQTRRTVLAGKASLPWHAMRGGRWEPGEALLAHGAGHDFARPIDHTRGCVKAGARAGLPTGGVSDRADEGAPRRPLALAQDRCVCLALGHQGLGREPCSLFQRRLDRREHVIIRRGRGRCLHMDHPMGCICLTGCRHMDFIGLCRKFFVGGCAEAVAPVCGRMKRPGRRILRPQYGPRLWPPPSAVVACSWASAQSQRGCLELPRTICSLTWAVSPA